MLTFMTAALLVYGSMHLYAFGKAWRVLPHSIALAVTLTLAGIALTFSPMSVWYMERQGWHDTAVVYAWVIYIWMGFLFLFFCIGVFFDLVHALTSLLRLKWPLNDSAAFRAICMSTFIAVGYGFFEARHIQIEEIKIKTPKLASGRVTIAQVSDLHLGKMTREAFLDRVLTKLHELKPDIVVATGDIVDGYGDGFDALAQRFKSFTPPLGAYAIIGNHEHYVGLDHSQRFLRNAGFTVLRGESAAIGGIILVGIDDPSSRTPDQPARMDTRKALASATKNDFIVLLKHQPVVDDDTPFDLQLSGHIHDGQIYPFVHLSRLVYDVRSGLTRLTDGRLLYVHRGTGTWGPPLRLLAPPEITLITIESTNR